MAKTWKTKQTVCRGVKSGKFATKGRCGAFKLTKVKRHWTGFLFK